MLVVLGGATMDSRITPFPALATLTLVTLALLTPTLPLATAGAQEDNVGKFQSCAADSGYPLGDPRRCQELARKDGYKVQMLEVLPGGGWDNLRNVEEGQVMLFNYSLCRTTQDGRFLLPDSVGAVPVKTSRVQTFAEFIMHWTNWTSTTANSINVEAGLSLSMYFGISGRFSSEFGDVKSKQILDNTVTTRTQLRYIRYGVQLQPDTPLHPAFRDRVLDIAAAEELGHEERARYLSQLLVRDFGTHVITKADAGAALQQVDQVSEDWVRKQTKQKNEILAAASFSLLSIFGMAVTYDVKQNAGVLNDYRTQRSSSDILTYGGPPFRPANFTPDSWAAQVDRDLVAMDRSGDPLYYVLTEFSLPELPPSTLNEVRERVKEAVQTYYSFNAVPGCLNPTAPNYTPAANVDDGSCQPPQTNLTFGGVFQTCSMDPKFKSKNLCSRLSQVNPLTGKYSCSEGYTAVELHSSSVSVSHMQHHCHSFWVFWQKCYDQAELSKANYTIYWCAAVNNSSSSGGDGGGGDGGGELPPDSGFLFGGLFTTQQVNPVTQTFSCPPEFYPLRVGSAADLSVCISDDFEMGEAHSLPFAGFFSCQAGNPLAVSRGGQGNEARRSKLKEFFQDKADDWPKRCPGGYSQHLAAVDRGCQISYCVRTGSLSGPALPPVKRPPFEPAPPLPVPLEGNLVLIHPASHTWRQNEQASQMLELVPAGHRAAAASASSPSFSAQGGDGRGGGGDGGRDAPLRF